MLSFFDKIPDALRGMLFGFLGFTVFTVGDASIKALSSDFPVFQIGFFNSVVVLSWLFLFQSRLGGIQATLRSPRWKLLWGRGAVMGVQGLLGMYAFANLPFTKAYTLIFVAPFVAALLGIVMLGDKVGWRRWVTIMLGFCGVLIVLRPGIIPLEFAALAAIGCGVLGALSWILIKYIGEGQTLMSYAFFPATMMFTITIIPALMVFEMPQTLDQCLLLFVPGTFGVIGMILLGHGFSIAPAAAVSPFHYTQLLFGVLWGYLFFNEIPDEWTFAGAAVILLSGLYIVYREHVKKQDVHDFAEF
jgi:drug/metabolite transporter (DMT)-like permease